MKTQPTLIIFDWKRTLYNPDTQKLIGGADTVLAQIKSKQIPLILLGKGGEDMDKEVKRLNVKKFFNKILFVGEEKTPEDFKPFLDPDNPKCTWVIGDRIKTEIAVANSLGMTTIWFKSGKFAEETPEIQTEEPDYIIKSLSEIPLILSAY